MQFRRFKYVFSHLHLVQLATTKAGASFSTFFLIPSRYYFREQSVKERMIWLGLCGATCKMSRKAEVAANFLTHFLKMLAWHYLNHWLELRVGDAVDEAHINHFHILIASIFILLFSCKTSRELAFCHEPLSVQCLTVGIKLCARWVVLAFRTGMAIWINCPAFHKHTTETSEDLSCKRVEIHTWDKKKNTLKSTHNWNLSWMFEIWQHVMFHMTIPTAMRDWSNPEAVYKRRDQKLLFKENSEGTLLLCVFSLSFPQVFISFDLKIVWHHVEANCKPPFDFDEIVVSPIWTSWNIINTPRDRA